jgi:hypothetical protein
MNPQNPFLAAITYLHVFDVQVSVTFYEQLGFQVLNSFTHPAATKPTWVFMQSRGACIMLAKSSGPIEPEQQAAMIYLYCVDVPAKREELVQMGLKPSEICTPFYAPRGEFRLADPDGYCLMIMHV